MEDENFNSKTNFLAASSYNSNVLSENFGLGPPDTTAIILVRISISQYVMLPINSTSGNLVTYIFLNIISSF